MAFSREELIYRASHRELLGTRKPSSKKVFIYYAPGMASTYMFKFRAYRKNEQAAGSR